jgi:PAS domain S-box-containing protein
MTAIFHFLERLVGHPLRLITKLMLVVVAFMLLLGVGVALAAVIGMQALQQDANAIESFMGGNSNLTDQLQLDVANTLGLMFLVIGIFLLLAMLGVVVVGGRVTQPITALVEGTGQVAEGNLDVRTPVLSNDELGQLADSFNRMAAQLKRRSEQLEYATGAMREREQLYRSIFEATTEGMLITDLEGGLVDFNPGACAILGYNPAEFAELTPQDLLHCDSQLLFQKYLQAIQHNQTCSGEGMFERKDGVLIDVEVYGAPLAYRGSPHGLFVLRDVTERRRTLQLLEMRVEERTRELQALLTVSQTMISTLELDPLLDLILDRLKEVVNYNGVSVFRIEEDQQHLRLLRERRPERFYRQEQFDLGSYGLTRQMIDSRTFLFIPNMHAADDPNADIWRQSKVDQSGYVPTDVGSWLSVPLLVKDRVVGILSLDHPQENFYTRRHVDLVMAFGTQAAVAMETARLYENLARELHDSVSQALYGIALGARTAAMLLKSDPQRLSEPLEYILSLADAGLAEMRALIFELRPESLAREGLVVALTKQADALRARHRLEVLVELCEEPDLPIEAKQALYRIAQEGMNNIIKHARASQVTVSLAGEEAGVRLTVEDNGQGFDPGGDFPGHLGLRSMRERAEHLGGSLEVRSAAGEGTTLTVFVPQNKGD